MSTHNIWVFFKIRKILILFFDEKSTLSRAMTSLYVYIASSLDIF